MTGEAQPWKARKPMLVRLSGSLVSAREVQPQKDPLPMRVRLAGRAIEMRNEQFMKA